MVHGLLGCAPRAVRPPVAPVRSTNHTFHGHTRTDDYAWLRDRSNPKVVAYLEAENAYTDSVMAPTRSLQRRLYKEMKARIKETDMTVPVRIDDYFYYTRTIQGRQYRVHCRKRGSLEADEEIMLDENKLARGLDYFRLGRLQVSPDHRLAAYSVDTTGGETFTVYLKDLTTGRLLADRIEGTDYGLEWGNDNRTLFYTVQDAAKRPYQVYRHTLGTGQDVDRLVHAEPDEAFHVRLTKTRSRRYLLMSLDSKVTSEVRCLDADRPEGEFSIVQPRRQGVEYSVEHHGDDFYIVTNDQAINFKLVKAPIRAPSVANWVEVLPHRPDTKLDGVDAFARHLAVHERREGLQRLRILALAGGPEHYVEFPEPVYSFRAQGNEEFDTGVLRFAYQSLVSPRTVFDYDMDARTREMKKREEVGHYDPADYQSERLFARAPDGTQVPLSLVYRQGMARHGRNPLLLYGYGSYGASMDPSFSSDRLSLLDRGFIFAVAHVRGGGELGRPWYEDGKFLNKKNTFTDFIACAEHLVAEGYTSPEYLAIAGGSAGGLLMGAVTNLRTDLFRAVVADVPFVDVVNTMLDPSIPLTVIEYEEWGNPHEERFYHYMLGYSPYDNVGPAEYPNMLVTAGLNDPRVQYWEPAKWTAKLRANQTGDGRLLLKTNMGAGHGGRSGRYQRLEETAFEYAFLLDALGLARS